MVNQKPTGSGLPENLPRIKSGFLAAFTRHIMKAPMVVQTIRRKFESSRLFFFVEETPQYKLIIKDAPDIPGAKFFSFECHQCQYKNERIAHNKKQLIALRMLIDHHLVIHIGERRYRK